MKTADKIINFFNINNRMPTFAEIQQMYNYHSKSAVSYFIDKLIKQRILGKTKTGKLFLLQKPGIQFFQSRIPAGFASPAEEELADTINLEEFLIENKEATFLLKVQGESMIEALIGDGDLILVERTSDFKNGDIVVAIINDSDYTVKYYKRTKMSFWLEPANPLFKNIYPKDDNQIKIIAKVIAIIRKL